MHDAAAPSPAPACDPRSCEPGARRRVAVLVSGGVDSSVALRLVQAAGHEVTAFYLQIWFQEDFRNYWDACPWEEDLGYARAVSQRCSVIRSRVYTVHSRPCSLVLAAAELLTLLA